MVSKGIKVAMTTATLALSFAAAPLAAQTADRSAPDGVLGKAITQILGGRDGQPVAYEQPYRDRHDDRSNNGYGRPDGRRDDDRYGGGNRGRHRQDDRRYRDYAMQQCSTAALQRAGRNARLDRIADAGRIDNGYRFEGRVRSSGRYPVAYQGRPQDRRNYGNAERTQDFTCSVRNGRIIGLTIR